jgi:hypothetical protein
VSSFIDQAQATVERIRQAAIETTGYDLRIVVALNSLEEALTDVPWQVWPQGCAHFAGATASASNRLTYNAFCGPWEATVRARLAELQAALTVAGELGQAEVVASLGDQAATMGEQAAAIKPTWTDAWAELPPWARWMIGLVAAREFLGIWGDVRR